MENLVSWLKKIPQKQKKYDSANFLLQKYGKK